MHSFKPVPFPTSFSAPTCDDSNVPWPQQKFIIVPFAQRKANGSDVVSVDSAPAEVNQSYIRVVVTTNVLGMNFDYVRADELLFAAFLFVDVQFPEAYLDIVDT